MSRLLGAATLVLLASSACGRAGIPVLPASTPSMAPPQPAAAADRPTAAVTAWLRPTAPAQATVAAVPSQEAKPAPRSRPATHPADPAQGRLLIPSLQIDSAIVDIPIVDGTWDLSALGTQIGWIATTGDQPGGSLAMAFVGHVTVSAAVRGPFADLWKTQLADEVVYRVGATDYIYAIQSKYAAQPDDVRRLYANDGQRLILVTCTDWNYLSRTYSERLIVQAELVRELPDAGPAR